MASEKTDPIMAFVPSSNPFLKCVDRLQDRIFSRLLVWARKTILLDVATVPISMVSTITLTRAIGINKLPSVFAVIVNQDVQYFCQRQEYRDWRDYQLRS